MGIGQNQGKAKQQESTMDNILSVNRTEVPVFTPDPKHAVLYEYWKNKKNAPAMTLMEWIKTPTVQVQMRGISLFLIFAGLGILVITWRAKNTMTRMRNKTTKRVEGKVVKTNTKWEGMNYIRYSTIQYQVGNQTLMDDFQVQKFKEGDTVVVCYDPDHPESARIESDEDKKFAKFTVGLSVIMIVIGIAMMVMTLL